MEYEDFNLYTYISSLSPLYTYITQNHFIFMFCAINHIDIILSRRLNYTTLSLHYVSWDKSVSGVDYWTPQFLPVIPWLRKKSLAGRENWTRKTKNASEKLMATGRSGRETEILKVGENPNEKWSGDNRLWRLGSSLLPVTPLGSNSEVNSWRILTLICDVRYWKEVHKNLLLVNTIIHFKCI